LSSCGKSYRFSASEKQCITTNYKNAYSGEYAGFMSWMYKSTSGCDKKLIGDWGDMQNGIKAIAGSPCISLTDSNCKTGSTNPPPPPPPVVVVPGSPSPVVVVPGSPSSVVVQPPSSQCTQVSQTSIQTSSASNWVVRNGWGMGDSSTLSVSSSALTLTTRQWGRNYYWIIQSASTYCLEANKDYSISFKLSESSTNQIYNTSISQCSTGCTGTTVEAISIDFINGFSAQTVSPVGVEDSQLNLKCNGEVWYSPLPTSSQPALAVSKYSPFTFKFTNTQNLQNVSFAVLLELFGKPSKVNTYTISEIVITKL